MTVKHHLGPALVRLLVAYVALCALFALAGTNILRPLAPVFGRELELLRPGVLVEEVAIQGSDVTVILKNVSETRGWQLRVTTDASFGFIYPIVVLSLLAAWPFGRWRPRLVAMGVAAGLLALFVIIDLPLDLAMTITRVLDEKSPFGSFFFNNGGRQFVALLIVAAALVAGERGRRPTGEDEARGEARYRRRGNKPARRRRLPIAVVDP